MSVITLKKKYEKSTVKQYLRASTVIPVLGYDKDKQYFLMDDKTVGIGFFCTPLNGADEKIQERVNGMLNLDMPAKTIMQFAMFRSPDINAQMYQMQALRQRNVNPLLQAVIDERVRFLKHHTRQSLTTRNHRGYFDMGVIQDLKLLVTVKFPIGSNFPTEVEEDEIERLRVKVESALQTVGLRPMPLDAKQYIRTMNTLVNWDPNAPWRYEGAEWDEYKPICEQVFDYNNALEVEKDKIRLGETHVRVLSAKKLADIMYFGDAIKYVGDLSGGDSRIKENYMVVMNVYFPDQEKESSNVTRKRQFAVNQAYGPMLKFVPVLADKKEGLDTIYDSMKEGNKLLKVSYSIVIFAPTNERAASASMQASSLWREQRFEMLEDKFVMCPMFINSLPLCSDHEAVGDLFRHKTLTADQVTPLLPIFGEWKGTGTFHAALISRNCQLMSLSLHDSDTNKNLVVAAESGSGKSFLMNELITSYLSEGAQVWVIDVGRSYEKLCHMLGGDFVHFGDDSTICLNPFELIEPRKNESGQLIDGYDEEEDGLVSIISTMASAKGLLTEWQQSMLRKVMSELWNELGKKMKLDHIAERCLEADDPRLKDIGQQLFSFTSKGSYGRFFSGDNNASFQNQFTVLELDDLQGRKHLRQVVLLQLIYQIQQEVFLGERGRKKVVIIDEAWDLLKEGEVSVFMEHAYRKFRKYDGSVGIATQSVNDLYENPVGRAIAENSANMYLLGQTEETVESIKRSGRLTLSDAGYHVLKTVHTIQGVYSEIFIKTKNGLGIGRLVVNEFQKLLYSTAPDDVSAIEAQRKRGLSAEEAIREVLRQRGVA